ncbi:unnamed protein product, partial [Ostreobium quekettii]
CRPPPTASPLDAEHVAGFIVVVALIALVVGTMAVVLVWCIRPRAPHSSRHLPPEPPPPICIPRPRSAEPIYVLHPGGGLEIGKREANKEPSGEATESVEGMGGLTGPPGAREGLRALQ